MFAFTRAPSSFFEVSSNVLYLFATACREFCRNIKTQNYQKWQQI